MITCFNAALTFTPAWDAPPFTPGDVVCLKSGFTDMVVGKVEGKFVQCHWHDSQEHAQTYTYPAAVLKRANTAEYETR